MKIKMLCSISGDWLANRGDIVDRPDVEAQRLIEAGFAELAEENKAAKPAKAAKAEG